MDEENIGESSKIKRKETGRGRQKRQNMESEAGVVWGAEVTEADEERNKFLNEGLATRTEGASGQGILKTFSDLECGA